MNENGNLNHFHSIFQKIQIISYVIQCTQAIHIRIHLFYILLHNKNLNTNHAILFQSIKQKQQNTNFSFNLFPYSHYSTSFLFYHCIPLYSTSLKNLFTLYSIIILSHNSLANNSKDIFVQQIHSSHSKSRFQSLFQTKIENYQEYRHFCPFLFYFFILIFQRSSFISNRIIVRCMQSACDSLQNRKKSN